MVFAIVHTLLAILLILPTFVASAPFTGVDSPWARGSLPQIYRFLDAHNSVRQAHAAAPLRWSNQLAQLAEHWADSCQFRSTDGVLQQEPYGENIAAATGSFSIPAAVDLFTSDQGQYDPASPTYNHWTQVVWKATTHVGCAVSRCDGIFDPTLGKATYYVCLYDPAGNVMGEAAANVQA